MALFAGRSAPDAVFCYSDLLAMGALRAALDSGLRVPDDVAIIGIDDIEEGRYSRPSLSTVSLDTAFIAREAVARIAARINDPATTPEKSSHPTACWPAKAPSVSRAESASAGLTTPASYTRRSPSGQRRPRGLNATAVEAPERRNQKPRASLEVARGILDSGGVRGPLLGGASGEILVDLAFLPRRCVTEEPYKFGLISLFDKQRRSVRAATKSVSAYL